MKQSQYAEGQIAFVLNQQKFGMSAAEVCRKMGIAPAVRSTPAMAF